MVEPKNIDCFPSPALFYKKPHQQSFGPINFSLNIRHVVLQYLKISSVQRPSPIWHEESSESFPEASGQPALALHNWLVSYTQAPSSCCFPQRKGASCVPSTNNMLKCAHISFWANYFKPLAVLLTSGLRFQPAFSLPFFASSTLLMQDRLLFQVF